MNGYSSAFWLALCASLTALGLVLTVLVGRKRSTRAMLHGAAWSLIPIAAYMTGSTLMLWRIGEAIGSFASSFVFSTLRWAGIGVVALVVVLFLASGGRARRKAAREGRATRVARKQEKRAAEAAGGGNAGPVTAGSRGAVTSGAAGGLGASGAGRVSESAGTPVAPRNPEPARRAKAAGGKPAADDDMADIEEILRKRGILPATHECRDPPDALARPCSDCAAVNSCVKLGRSAKNFLLRDTSAQITFGSRLPEARSLWFPNHR